MALEVGRRAAHGNRDMRPGLGQCHRARGRRIAAADHQHLAPEKRRRVVQAAKDLGQVRPRHVQRARVGERPRTDQQKPRPALHGLPVLGPAAHRAHAKMPVRRRLPDALHFDNFLPGRQRQMPRSGHGPVVGQGVLARRAMPARDKERDAADCQLIGGRKILYLLRMPHQRLRRPFALDHYMRQPGILGGARGGQPRRSGPDNQQVQQFVRIVFLPVVFLHGAIVPNLRPAGRHGVFAGL